MCIARPVVSASLTGRCNSGAQLDGKLTNPEASP